MLLPGVGVRRPGHGAAGGGGRPAGVQPAVRAERPSAAAAAAVVGGGGGRESHGEFVRGRVALVGAGVRGRGEGYGDGGPAAGRLAAGAERQGRGLCGPEYQAGSGSVREGGGLGRLLP